MNLFLLEKSIHCEDRNVKNLKHSWHVTVIVLVVIVFNMHCLYKNISCNWGMNVFNR